jgi:hypothetical protein
VQLPAFCASEHPPTQIEKRPEDSTVVRRLLHCGSSIRPMSALVNLDTFGRGDAAIHVRYASNTDRIGVSQRTDAKCQKATYAAQIYSITSSAGANSVGGAGV